MPERNNFDVPIAKRDIYDKCLTVFISKDLRDRILVVSRKANRSISEVVRRVLYKSFMNRDIG